MATLSEEVQHVQNPALGGMLVWRHVVGYQKARADAAGCPLPLLFVVLPILLHQETLAHVQSTRPATGLRGFGAKFGAAANNESDVLLALNERAIALRPLSLQSLRVAVGARMLTVDSSTGVAHALTRAVPKAGIPEQIRDLARNAEKLGHWCAALTLLEIASVLRVRF
jgi:hypothetical protein